jgi:hypothetical protein
MYSGLSLWRYVIDGPSLSFMSTSLSLSLQRVLAGWSAECTAYSLAKELQRLGMHLPDIIQINELREFLTKNALSWSCLKKTKAYAPRGRQASPRPQLPRTNCPAYTRGQAVPVVLPSTI